MGSEDQRRPAVVPHVPKTIVDFRRVEHVAEVVRVGLEHLQAIDMSEFSRHAPEIVPNAAQDRFDVSRGLFRKGGGEIGAADPVFLQSWTERAHDAAGEVGHALAVDGADRPQRPDRQRSERGVGARLEALADAIGETS